MFFSTAEQKYSMAIYTYLLYNQLLLHRTKKSLSSFIDYILKINKIELGYQHLFVTTKQKWTIFQTPSLFSPNKSVSKMFQLKWKCC